MSIRSEKLLREAIREILVEKDAAIKVGDLRKALKLADETEKKDVWKEAGVEAGKKAAEKGLEALVGLIPFGGTAWTVISTAKDIKDIYQDTAGWKPEEKEQNPLWDFITIDPNTSTILDDKVERDFIKSMSDRVAALDDEQYLPNADDQLAGYLTQQHDGTYIAKDSE